MNDGDAPDGLEQVRRLLNGSTQYRGIVATMGLRLVEAELGHAVFEGDPDERFYNPIGSVHGGYAATLLDSAVGIAVHSRLSPTQAYTTLELKIAYHRALTHESGPVRAVGSVLSFGRRAAFAEGKLTDAQGRLCASATSTLLVYER